jgi:site-specific DNA-methyltransferase (adenine-specific)
MITKLFVGDNVEVMRREVADNSIQLTVTSPPYDNLRKYNGFTWDFEAVARELYRVTKPGGVVVWVVGDSTVKGDETCTSFRQALYFRDCGFRLHDTMIYHKMPPPTVDIQFHRYYQHFEYMFVFSKGTPDHGELLREPKKYMDKRKSKVGQKATDGNAAPEYAPSVKTDKVRGNVWYYNVGLYGSTSDREAFKHPAIYPEALAHDHILSWSNPGDTVLDPFLGSGTTGKMSAQLGRFFIGCDISPEYVEIARKRIGTEVAIDDAGV